jgi:hypothetical protein
VGRGVDVALYLSLSVAESIRSERREKRSGGRGVEEDLEALCPNGNGVDSGMRSESRREESDEKRWKMVQK